jgi:methionyl-tRNA synthetase
VHKFWDSIKSSIGMGSHSGFYSTNEETFFVEKDLTKDGDDYRTPAGEICEEVVEQNYVFVVQDEAKQQILQWAETTAV